MQKVRRTKPLQFSLLEPLYSGLRADDSALVERLDWSLLDLPLLVGHSIRLRVCIT
jgi:hypothetical protein